MKRSRIGKRGLTCLFVALASMGCGQDTGGLTLVKVTGQVTTDSEPFANGMVQFIPKQAGKSTGGSAVTDENGYYSLKHTSNRKGIEPGEYNVRFSLLKLPDGSELPDQSEENHPKSPMELGAIEWVPLEYSSMSTTKNSVTVEESGGNFDFEIPKLEPQKPQVYTPPKKHQRRERD